MTRLGTTLILFALATAPLAPVAAQDLLWTRQIGTSSNDDSMGMAVDGSGNAYVAGGTVGSLGGPNAGGWDPFLIKYDAAGTLLWTRQFGTSAYDEAWDVVADGAGNAYVTGRTSGNLGGTNAGLNDAFLAKYDASGTVLWTRQTGTTANDYAYGVAVGGAGNPYIAGDTSGNLGGTNAGGVDVFLAKYNVSGTLLWKRQIGTTSNEHCDDVAVDSAGNAYITGDTLGSLGGPNAGSNDAFLAKYDASGTLLWTRQIGTTSYDYAEGVAVDSGGNVYITGGTGGNFGGPNAGSADVFLAKYSASGTLLWTRQIGTPDWQFGDAVAVDGADNVYLGGRTDGSFGGSGAGGEDAFLAKFDASGALLWMRQIGTTGTDFFGAAAVDGTGNAYITGSTYGSLGGPNAGNSDTFLVKYSAQPCPSDYNHDTFVSGDDFDQFVADFELGLPAADVNGDTFVSGDDFDFFVEHFEAGC